VRSNTTGEMIPLDLLASSKGRVGITRRFPIGPVAGISPFNFPLNLVAHKVAPALAAGCPFVLKPAPKTPIGALIIGEVLAENQWDLGDKKSDVAALMEPGKALEQFKMHRDRLQK